jgi:hypothetical protein
LEKQFFQTFFAETPLTAYLYAGYFTLANQAVQGSFLNLQKLCGVSDVQDIVRHWVALLFCNWLTVFVLT